MAINPNILQQYVDEYAQQAAAWQRQGSRYNKAIEEYNALLDKYKAETQPKIEDLQGKYTYELEHYNKDIQQYNDNLWASNRDYWNNWLNEVKNYHYGQANQYGQQMAALEKTIPQAPSVAKSLFNEKLYLAENPDVAQALAKGQIKSAWDHYLQYGRLENRNAASGGKENEKALQEAAAWEVKALQERDKYLASLGTARFLGTVAEARTKTGTPGITSAMQGYGSAADLQSASDLVKAAYQTYLGRAPNTEGLAFWAGAITSGTRTPQQVLNDIQQSAEGKTYAANQIKPVTSAMSSFLSGGQNIFDEKYYLANNPDVAAAVAKGQIASGLQHYQQFGVNEGRKTAQTIFNEQYYLANNPDVAQAVAQGKFQSGLQHYQSTGYKEGRKAYAVNPQTADAIVKAAYQTYLGRAPDAAGLKYWAAAIQNGDNPQTILDNIQASQEAKTYTATKMAPLNTAINTYKTNEYTQDTKNLISAAFKEYMGRDPDQGGLDFWTNEVTSGRMAPQDVLNSITQSAEAVSYGNQTVNRQGAIDAANVQKAAYEKIQTDRPQLDWFAGQKTPARVTNALATNDPTKIVQAAYSAYLGRQPEATGLANWTNEIKTGKMTPQQAIDAIRRSEEGKTYGGQFLAKAPSFTQAQIGAMSGQASMGQQRLAEMGGLIATERVNAASERNTPSGILAKAKQQQIF